MLYEEIVTLIGEVPYGYEPLAWCLCCVLLFFLLQTAFSVLFTIVKWLGGAR